MDKISQILEDRIINDVKNFGFYKDNYKINKEDFDSKLKNLKNIRSHYSNEIIIRALKLFDSKIQFDISVFKWNKKNEVKKKKKKQFSFIQYSRIDENGKSIKSLENFNSFYSDIKEQYHSQTKLLLQKDLPWIKDNFYIKPDDCVCYYCGIHEKILSELYNDQ